MPEDKQKTETVRCPSESRLRAVLFRKERFWMSAAQWGAIALATAVGLAAVVLVFRLGVGESPAEIPNGVASPDRSAPEAAAGEMAYDGPVRAIDGKPAGEEEGNGPHYAVMIDSHFDAWPLAGLASAPLVYEAPVEGGITRLLAFYPHGEIVREIGPVRSARPYYIDWAAEFDALYVHVGGSPESLERLKTAREVFDFNEYWNGQYFWRDRSRQAPHQVMTSTGLLGSAFAAKYGDSDLREIFAWPFKADVSAADRPEEAPDLLIDWSTPTYAVVWRYDRERNGYRRHQSGRPQQDRDGSPVWAKNVIVQFHEIAVTDSVGRRRIGTVGEGRAVVLRDGERIEAVWRKPSVTDRTRYFTSEGEEVAMNAGNTWVEIVSEKTAVQGI